MRRFAGMTTEAGRRGLKQHCVAGEGNHLECRRLLVGYVYTWGRHVPYLQALGSVDKRPFQSVGSVGGGGGGEVASGASTSRLQLAEQLADAAPLLVRQPAAGGEQPLARRLRSVGRGRAAGMADARREQRRQQVAV